MQVAHTLSRNAVPLVWYGTRMNTPPHATQADAVAHLIERSKRRAVPIRNVFLQRREAGALSPGPFHSIVRNHDERALDLYLLVVLVAVAAPYKAMFEAGGWARALGLPNPMKPAAVS